MPCSNAAEHLGAGNLPLPHPFDFKTRNPRQIPSPAIIQAEHRQVNVNTHLDAYTIPQNPEQGVLPSNPLWQDRWHLQLIEHLGNVFTLPIKDAFPPLCPSQPVGASQVLFHPVAPLSIGVFCWVKKCFRGRKWELHLSCKLPGILMEAPENFKFFSGNWQWLWTYYVPVDIRGK